MIPQIHYKDEGKHNDEAESTDEIFQVKEINT
jgi:hypothetical protein